MEVPPELLRRDHCRGACEGKPAACACGGNTMTSFVGSEKKALFVGGGLSAIEAAKICLSSGQPAILVERLPMLGGIWCVSANPESRIQVDPVAFRPIEDETPTPQPDPSDPFASIYPSRRDVLNRLAQHVETYGIMQHCVFSVQVVRFEKLPGSPGLVRVYMKAVPTGGEAQASCACCTAALAAGEFFKDFKELHVRTGSLTPSQHRSSVVFKGEGGAFPGTVVTGTGNDFPMARFRGLHVLIIGMGAFAVENARRAICGGAASVTLLSRRFDKLLFPELATFMLRHRLQQEGADSEQAMAAMWRDVHAVVEAGAAATGLRHAVLNSDVVRFIEGQPHFVFAKGLPSVASNTLLLAHHYGLARVLCDEVAELLPTQPPRVATTGGRRLRADVVIKCLGFGTDDSLLRGHTVRDCFFIDGAPHMTHNLRSDRVNGAQLIGPRVRATNFLISYYEDAQEYERAFRRLIDHPPAFAELCATAPTGDYELVQAVDYFTTLRLSDKLAGLRDAGVRQVYERNRQVRRRLYRDCLDERTFIRYDQQCWDKLSRHFARLTGKPVLLYPFDIHAATAGRLGKPGTTAASVPAGLQPAAEAAGGTVAGAQKSGLRSRL